MPHVSPSPLAPRPLLVIQGFERGGKETTVTVSGGGEGLPIFPEGHREGWEGAGVGLGTTPGIQWGGGE